MKRMDLMRKMVPLSNISAPQTLYHMHGKKKPRKVKLDNIIIHNRLERSINDLMVT